MTDRYQEIRKALAMGPTPGPWAVRYDYAVQARAYEDGRLVPVAQPYGVNCDGTDLFANARLIAACDPDTIRALFDERDALGAENARLREALRKILENEASDWKAAEEFGGYVLDDELREEARAVLEKENSND